MNQIVICIICTEFVRILRVNCGSNRKILRGIISLGGWAPVTGTGVTTCIWPTVFRSCP